MKKLILFISILFFILFANVQISVQSQNLLANPSFETWTNGTTPDGWTLGTSTYATSTPNSSVFTDGAKSLKVTAAATAGGTYSVSQIVPITPGKTYTLRMSYFIEDGDGTDARIWSAWCNVVGSSITYTKLNHDDSLALMGPGGGSAYFPDIKGEWHTYTCDVVAPTTGCNSFSFQFRTYKTPAVVYWDNMYFGEAQQALTYPNLHVSSVSASNLISGNKTTVEWTVKNDGARSTQKNSWRDKIWLVPDITKNFASTGYLLSDVQNMDSLVSGDSYHNSTEVTIPERLQGMYYLVVTSDMNNIASIDWHPAGDTIPNPYIPSNSGVPYSYLKAHTGSTSNSMYEEGEINDISDNFNYKKIQIYLPDLADLQVTSIHLPTQLIADRKATINATIYNKGKVDIIGKTWIDRIYIGKDDVFNKANATLLGSVKHSTALQKDSSYVATFQIIAPSDTLSQIRFFVETDVLDSVFESIQDNNVTASSWLKLLPNRIDITDYQALCYFFNTSSGLLWNKKWDLSSNIINSTNWQGVSFEDGHVTAISLPSNQIKGGVPLVLLTLPKLRDLNLSNNQLTSRIDSTVTNAMLISSFKTDSLVSINLAYNLFEGEIPSIFRTFIHLKSLNLEGNMLNALVAPLPLNIASLNLRNQTIKIDSIQLSLTPSIKIPTISTYNHLTQSFDFFPNLSLFNNDVNIGGAYYNGSNYQLFTTNQMSWTFDSGQSFVLRQENGLASGTRYLFKIFFIKGDANIDQQVDILDVQHSLNYLLGDNPQPFNFSAANTYKDTLITVQDIVNTVNIILNSPIDSKASSIQRIKNEDSSPNQLYIANNKLMLEAVEPVAAMDITLTGITDKQLKLILSNTSFQIIARTMPEGATRFIVFSPTGDEIKQGKNIVAELYSENVSILSAKLSDKRAQIVSVSLNNDQTTGIKTPSDIDFTVYIVSNRAIITLPSDVEKLQATLYTSQGVMVDDRVLVDLVKGKNAINYNSSALSSGVYLLKLSANTQDKIRIIKTKLIISK